MIQTPCTLRLRADSGSDIYGDDTEAVTEVATVCEVQPRSVQEPLANLSSEDWVAFFLPGTAELANSASGLYVPGVGSFEVIGDPWLRTNPVTREPVYVRANLTRTAGPEDPLS